MGWCKRKREEKPKNTAKINKTENRAASRYNLFETISGNELIKINNPEDDSDSDMSSQQRQRLENMRRRRPVFHIGPKPKADRELDSQAEEDTDERPLFHERDLYLGSQWIRHKICDWPCPGRIPIPLRYKLMPPYSHRYNSRNHSTLTFRKPSDSVRLAFLLPRQLMDNTKRRLLMHYGSELSFDTKGCRLPMEYDYSPRSANEKNRYLHTLQSVTHSRRVLQQIEQLANKNAAAAIGNQLSPAERERVEQLKAANQLSLPEEQSTEDLTPAANQVTPPDAMPTANQIAATNVTPSADRETDRQSKQADKTTKRNGKKAVKVRRKAGINKGIYKDINSRRRSRR